MNRQFLHILIQITIFLYSFYFFREPFEGYFAYLVYLVLFPFFILKFGIAKLPILVFIPMLLSGVIYIQIGLNTWPLFIKVFAGFFLSVLFYYYVFRLFNFEVKELFSYYLKAATIVSLIGLIQVASYQVGFNYGYNLAHYGLNKWSYTPGGLGIRLNSILSEPSYFAAIIAPAFFVALLNVVRRNYVFIGRTASIIIIIAYLLTFSSVGILGIFLAVLFLLLNFGLVRYVFVFIPMFYFGFYFAYNNIEEFRDRFDGTLDIFSADGDVNSYDIHGSSFVLFNNWHIASENFIRNPLFGTGLGSHPIAFDKYSLTNMAGVIQINFNKADANSMFLRLLSETGLYGVGLILFILVRHYLYRGKTAGPEYWIISNAVALIILLYLLRQGHYFLNGFPFFMWMYYFNWKKNHELKALAAEPPIFTPNPRLNPKVETA